jgi:serine/threonine protein kinase
MAMGTLHYMAPEALMLGSAVDHRADIYAVGVMLYQMLTGKLPQGMFELPSDCRCRASTRATTASSPRRCARTVSMRYQAPPTDAP